MTAAFSRRQFLGGSLGLAGAALLAACGTATTATPTTAPAASAGGAAAPTAQPSVAPSTAASAIPATSAAPAASIAPAASAAPATTSVPSASTAASKVGVLPSKLLEIDYWHRSTGDAAKAFETLAADFNKQYEGKIKVTPSAQGSIADLNKKVRAAAAGGGLPGALMADDYDATQYAYSKITVDLEPYVADPQHGLSAEQRADFLPSQINRHKLPIYNNQLMAFPQGFSAFATYWNVDALQKAGLSAPPKTWKEFPDHVRTVAKANPGMAGWFIGGAGDRFISTMLTAGVDWLSADGKTTNFDRPEATEIMTWWKQLYDEKLLDIPKENARDLFIAQKCAYFMDSSGNAVGFTNLVKDFKWDVSLPPQAAAGGTVTETYGPVNVIPKTDAEKQLAGWLWLKWLSTPAPLASWVTATSYFPSTKSAAEGPTLKEFYAKNAPAAKALREIAPNARILTPSPALTQVRGQIVADAVNQVLLGQLTPDAGVKKMKAEADKAVRETL